MIQFFENISTEKPCVIILPSKNEEIYFGSYSPVSSRVYREKNINDAFIFTDKATLLSYIDDICYASFGHCPPSQIKIQYV